MNFLQKKSTSRRWILYYDYNSGYEVTGGFHIIVIIQEVIK